MACGQQGRSEATEHYHLVQGPSRRPPGAVRRIRALYDAGGTGQGDRPGAGLGRRRVERWVRLIVLPERNAMAPKACTPAYHEAFLARRWADGTTAVLTSSPTSANAATPAPTAT
jgi:hypothetical protein